MKAIMISIKPKWCAKIMNGDKTIEVRTSKALARAIQKLIDKYGHADIYAYCSKDTKNLLHKNYADIYWGEDEDFRNKNKQLGLQTQPILNGKVLFKFRCYRVDEIDHWYPITPCFEQTCLSLLEFDNYIGSEIGYAINISDLEIFDKPKELSEFGKCQLLWNCVPHNCQECPALVRLTKAPQNFCYLEVE